jgi:predicted dehydrogenase
MFTDAIYGPYADKAELVALCDVSRARMACRNRQIVETFDAEAVPTFHADEFDRMIRATKPDTVIVTTVDATHHTYLVRAMELGCDAVTEKPMTTDAKKAEAIFDAVERTGRDLRVTFNYRYMSVFTKVAEVVRSGAIGRPTLVDFQWRLDTSHGADYFRRWHREKKHSGGLLVHKSTHHFDLVNWILDASPTTVSAMGSLAFYGEQNAAERGQPRDFRRYADGHLDDPFAVDITTGSMKGLYHDAEGDSGYIRDRNVFGGESEWPITSEDTMAVTARYANGALLSYSLVAYSPWEGERLTITGTQGQVEYFGRGTGHIIAGQSDEALTEAQYQGEKYIRVQRMFEPPREVAIPEAKGGHGGGDAGVLERVFNPEAPPDSLGRDADHRAGAASIALGIAANRSIETGEPVEVASLMPWLAGAGG